LRKPSLYKIPPWPSPESTTSASQSSLPVEQPETRDRGGTMTAANGLANRISPTPTSHPSDPSPFPAQNSQALTAAVPSRPRPIKNGPSSDFNNPRKGRKHSPNL
jgi:hypothetical protein